MDKTGGAGGLILRFLRSFAAEKMKLGFQWLEKTDVEVPMFQCSENLRGLAFMNRSLTVTIFGYKNYLSLRFQRG
jgi:hypothetical protein